MPPVKLLFVDDEPKLQAVVRQLFRREVRQGQYSLVFALDGVEALATLEANPDIQGNRIDYDNELSTLSK